MNQTEGILLSFCCVSLLYFRKFYSAIRQWWVVNGEYDLKIFWPFTIDHWQFV